MSDPYMFFLTFDEARDLIIDRLLKHSLEIKNYANNMQELTDKSSKYDVEEFSNSLDDTISKLISIRTTLDQMAMHKTTPLSNNKIFVVNK